MITKPLFLCLLAVFTTQGTMRACQYCALAANDPEMARLAAEMHAKAGGFPLDGAINQFQPAAQSPVLSTPPPSASVATRAADLPPALAPRHVVPPPAPVVQAGSNQIDQRLMAGRWANGGLLGLLGLAGFFGWRTRRAGSGVAS